MAEKFNKAGGRPGSRSNSERGDKKFSPKGDKFKGDSKKVYSRNPSAGEGRPEGRFSKEGGYGDKKYGGGEKRYGSSERGYGRSGDDRSGAPKRTFGGNRSEGSDRPYGGNRSEGSGSGRSYGGNRSEGGNRSYGSNRPEGGNRSYGGNRTEGQGRSFGGNRSEGTGPGRSYGGNRSEGTGRPYGGNRSEGSERGFGGNRSDKPWAKSGSGFKKPGFGKGYGRDEEFKKPEVPRGRPGERNRSFKNDKEFKPEMSERYDPTSERPKTEPTTDRPESREPRGFGRPERPGYGDRGFKKSGPNSGFSKGRSFDRDRDTSASGKFEGNDELDENRPVRPAREFKTDGPDRERKKSYPKGDRENFGRDAKKSFGGERNFDNRDERKPYDRDTKKSFGRDKRTSDRDERKSFDRKNDIDRRAEGTPAEAPAYNLKRYTERETKRKPRNTDDTIRLNRYIANAGVCSRREADSLIESGEIKVNGETITEMGYLVKPGDTIHYGKKLLSREKLVYVLLNKPKDFITTTEDPEGRKTVMDLVATASKERIFPVGRLDRNTTGLLLFTNDGEVAQKLTHPSHKNSKIYQVELDKPITTEHFEQIQNGLELEDGKAEVDDLAIISPDNKFLGIEIHIGKNRIVRRIFEHLGYEVVSLDRVQYAGLTKKDLPRGKWRFLSEREVVRLKYFM